MTSRIADALSLDFETASFQNLLKTGSHVYFEDERTKAHCASYSIGEEEPQLWVEGDPCPPIIREHVKRRGRFRAWNAQFESDCCTLLMPRKYGWPVIPPELWDDTQAEAMAMGLPAALGDATKALGLDEQKDDEGHRVMMQLARPRKATKRRGEATLWSWEDDPEKFSILYSYNLQDNRAERGVVPFVRPLSPREERIRQITRKMNMRGIGVDLALVDALQVLIDAKIARLNAELAIITLGEVQRVSDVGSLKLWIRTELGPDYMRDHDIDLETLSKEDIADLLVLSDLPQYVRRALEIRQEAGKASTAKLKAFRLRTSRDGFARNFIKYYGATTGRWSSTGIQLQNLVRPHKKLNVDAAIADIMTGMDVDTIEAFHELSIMEIAAGCLRSCLIPGELKEFIYE